MVLENFPKWLSTLGYALALSTSFELLYYLNTLRRNNRNDSKPKEDGSRSSDELEVLFFPDQAMACEAYFSYGCSNKSCWLSHEETSSQKVVSFLERTRKTLDLCVYCIASDVLLDIIIKVHEQGVVVRVITDLTQASEQQATMERLRAAGIAVRTNNSTFLMHHKFAIVDNKHVMTGSFNWSRNALLGNDENVVLIRQKKITDKYLDVFENLWSKYNPASGATSN